jgi:hypothetical protein
VEESLATQCRVAAAFDANDAWSEDDVLAPDAPALCKRALDESPANDKVWVYYGRTLLWADQYDEAHKWITHSAARLAAGKTLLGYMHERGVVSLSISPAISHANW